MSEKKEKTTTEVTKKSKKTSEKKEAPAKKKEFPVKAIFEKVKKFFKDFKGEWKKVTWPSRKTVLNQALVVIVIVLVVGLVIFGIDTGLSETINGLVGLAGETTTKASQQMLSLFMMK